SGGSAWRTSFALSTRLLSSGRKVTGVPPSAGGVPAFRKRNEAPGRLVVVGGARRLLLSGSLRVAQKILLRGRRNGRSHGVQQSIELSFTHDALPHSGAQRLKSLLLPD